MMSFRNPRTAAVLSLALLFSAAACSKKADDAVVTADTTSMSMPPAAPAALRVSDVETGKSVKADKTLTDDMDDFGVRDTIYVSVKTEGTGAGTLAAKWTFQDGQMVEEASQSISPTGDAWHEFHIQKASAWPKGKYKVEISLNGVPADSEDFTIK